MNHTCDELTVIINQLAAVGTRRHRYCEDSWYSCPKSEDGCANPEWDDDECVCGADNENAKTESLRNHAIHLLEHTYELRGAVPNPEVNPHNEAQDYDKAAKVNPSLDWKWCPKCGGRWMTPEPVCESCGFDCTPSWGRP